MHDSDFAQDYLNQHDLGEIVTSMETREDYTGELETRGTEHAFNDGDLVAGEELAAKQFYQELSEVAPESQEETVELFLTYGEQAGTVTDAAHHMTKPAPSVTTDTLDILQDELGVVDVNAGNVDYTDKGEKIYRSLDTLLE